MIKSPAILLVVLVAMASATMAFSSSSAPSSANVSAKPTKVTSDDGVVLQERYIQLPTTGVTAQIIYGRPQDVKSIDSSKPPLVLLHGSFHSAWCWQEHWIPYFVKQGYRCVAMSWRGTDGTPPPSDNVRTIKILEHCDDLRGLLQTLPMILNDGGDGPGLDDEDHFRPILVSHSMGGIYVMKFLEEECNKHNNKNNKNDNNNNNQENSGHNPTSKKLSEMLSGIATFCSTPPSGNGPSTFRVIRRSLRDAYRITIGFVAKKVNTDTSICRQCFFGGEVIRDDDGNIINDHGVTDEDVARYQEHFLKDSKIVLDVADLSRRLPSELVDTNGKAPFVSDLPPCIVVGAKDDFIVDAIGNQETASYYGLDEPVFVDSPHDVMLGKNWKEGANILREWIEQTVVR